MSKKILMIVVFAMALLAFAVPAFACDNYSPGYWKNHVELWPAGSDPDDTFFLSGKTWEEVLNTPPRGNFYFILAHQYIACELNCLNKNAEEMNDSRMLCEEFFNDYAPNDDFENRDYWLEIKDNMAAYNN